MPDLSVILNMLDRDDVLDLSTQRSREDGRLWPTTAGEQVLEVDYSSLFPARSLVDRGSQDFEVYGDQWYIDDEAAAEIVEGVGSAPGESDPPEWDVWAWYQP